MKKFDRIVDLIVKICMIIVLILGITVCTVGIFMMVHMIFCGNTSKAAPTETTARVQAKMMYYTVEVTEPEVIEVHTETPKVSEIYAESIPYLAKTVYGEARGCTAVEQAAVIWCILNRVDANGYSDSIIGVVTQKNAFHGYNPNHPVTDHIYNLTVDVLERWEKEKNGEVNVGRVLPKEYLWFYGDGKRNHFTNQWRGGNTWNWALESPYIN